MKSYRFIISGRVQGVWYRRSIQVGANMAGFSGYVRNLRDGTVEAGVTCEAARLEEFRELLWRGSEASHVKAVEQYESSDVHDGGFEVLR
jgi:acylphosphatase